MLIWLCALKCEAKPLIDLYRLRKDKSPPPFSLYRGDGMACVVSGIGRAAMQTATRWSGHLASNTSGNVWINLGIAGHANLPIGTLRLAASFALPGNMDPLPARSPIDSPIEALPLVTFDDPQTAYPPQAMADMEGHAFALAAQAITNPKWRQSIKIISDNQASGTTRNKPFISGLISEQIHWVDQFAQAIMHQANLANDRSVK
jgi:adenosylhomocysteine nucleosidase